MQTEDVPDQEERTEEATPQRRERAREKGQLARSRDLTSALTLLGGIGALSLCGQGVALALGDIGYGMFGRLDQAGVALSLVVPGAYGLMWSLLPFFAATTLCALGSILIQTGPPQSSWLTFDLDRINPLPRLLQMFSVGTGGWDLLRTALKIGGVGLAAWQLLYPAWQELLDNAALTPRALLERMLGLSGTLLLRLGMLLFALAVLDYLMMRWRTEKELRMSRREIREELRQSEGDPQVKRRLRRKARELLKRRLAVDVPKADVVVVNPTHVAVALMYKPDKMRAPRVVAKGLDHLAMRIRELARGAGVPVISNPPLARDLHRRVKVGKEIPSDLYRAVAEVLAFVYRIRQQSVVRP